MMIRWVWLRALPLFALATIFAAGCADGSDRVAPIPDGTTEDGVAVPLDVDGLMDSSWLLEFGGGPEGDVPLVEDWPITLTFGDGALGGRAACNGYRADYLIDGSELRLERLTITEAGCEAHITESERVFMAALSDVDGINLIDDELALSGPSSELLFRRTE